MTIFSPMHTLDNLCQGALQQAKQLVRRKSQRFEATQSPQSTKSYAQAFWNALASTGQVSAKCAWAFSEGTKKTIFPLTLFSLATIADSFDPSGASRGVLCDTAMNVLNGTLDEVSKQFERDRACACKAAEKHTQDRALTYDSALVVLDTQPEEDSELDADALASDLDKVKDAVHLRAWKIRDKDDNNAVRGAIFPVTNPQKLPSEMLGSCNGSKPWAPGTIIDPNDLGLPFDDVAIFMCCPASTDLSEENAPPVDTALPLQTPPAAEGSNMTPMPDFVGAAPFQTEKSFSVLQSIQENSSMTLGILASVGIATCATTIGLLYYLCAKGSNRATQDDIERARPEETKSLG